MTYTSKKSTLSQERLVQKGVLIPGDYYSSNNLRLKTYAYANIYLKPKMGYVSYGYDIWSYGYYTDRGGL